MTTSERRVPTATAREHRLRIFDATRRPAAVSTLLIATQWGRIRRTGKLGQAHADLLDAILFSAEKKGEMEDGRLKLLVDPAKVRRLADITSGAQFQKLTDELLAAVIEIKEPVEMECIGHLVDHIDMARRADGTPITRFNPLNKGERSLWRVELGKALCKLLSADIWRGYNPAPIARLQYGISQAVARHALTHRHEPTGGWILDGLIRAVAGEIGAAIRDRRRELRRDADGMEAIGLRIEGERLRRVEQTPGSVEQTPGRVE